MRIARRAIVTTGLIAGLLACMDANRIIVHTGKIDDRTNPDVGDEYDIEHLPADTYTQQKPGFYMVHSDQDWLFVWKDPRPDAKPPPPPQNVDYKKKMIFVATSTSENAKSIEIQKVMSLYSGLHIYVLETLPGSSCVRQPNKPPPMDIVELDTVNFDVHVHYDRAREETCGPPPDAVIQCRIAGSGAPGTDNISAAPGDTIDCDGSKSKAMLGSIVERNWQVLSTPPGSAMKLVVGKESIGVTFAVDAWGSYSVGLSVHDAAREGSAMGIVTVPAPEGGVELYWTDRAADPATLPRAELHVVELPFTVGAGFADCGLAAAKPWCEVHTAGALQHAVLNAEKSKRYKVAVKYVDERRPGNSACIRTFPKGGKATSICDEATRKAGSVWNLGAFDIENGRFYDANLPKPPPLPVVAATGGDGGAPTPATKPDSGAPTPTPTPAAKPDAGIVKPPTGGGTDIEL